MTPLFFRLHTDLQLMIIPDTQAHLDGHTIITHTYSIFKDIGIGNPLLARTKESTLHLEKIEDPNYYGYITFDLSDKLLIYTPDGAQELEDADVEKVIEFLSNIRTNPALWGNID